MFSRTKKLFRSGVLGMNRRNADYTLFYNSRKFYPLVDDKLQTKQIALKAGLAVPELYAVVETEYQIRRELPNILNAYSDFAVKPTRGSGGNGIMVLSKRANDRYRRLSGVMITYEELAYHVSNILSGMYSLGGLPDKAMIEYRVQFDPLFEAVSYQGVPDIRIIVFLGVPVMSMVRLPTRESNGKANLHQGAVGVGIDIATGKTGTGVWRNTVVVEHPDTGNNVTGLKIPDWEKLLHLAASCYELTALGYIGVDIVLDKDRGPLILELNARPGLSIQIANRQGLLPRLKHIEFDIDTLKSIDDRVAFAVKHFHNHDTAL